jgi:hypothetical protein
VQNGGSGIQLGQGLNPHSPTFLSAQHACRQSCCAVVHAARWRAMTSTFLSGHQAGPVGR